MIHEKGNTLEVQCKLNLEEKEYKLTDKIKQFFKTNPNCRYTAQEIHEKLNSSGLLTSTRRALSDLKRENFIVKDTNNKKPGFKQHNKPVMVCTWMLNDFK